MTGAAASAGTELTPTEAPPDEAAARWAEASERIRSTTSWLIAALAAAGAVVFGAGPLLRGFDGSDLSRGRLIAIAAGVLVGVSALVVLVGLLVRAQLPVLVDVQTWAEDAVNAAAVERILGHRGGYERALSDHAAVATALRRATVDRTVRRAAVQQARALVLSGEVVSDVVLDRRTAALTDAERRLADAVEDETELRDWAAGAELAIEELERRARFTAERQRLDSRTPKIGIAAVVAVGGAVLYLGGLGAEADDDDGAAPSGAAEVATVEPVGAAGTKIFAALGIDETCRVMTAQQEGTGDASSYTVTISSRVDPDCPAQAFTVDIPASAITVSTEEPVTHTIEALDPNSGGWILEPWLVIAAAGLAVFGAVAAVLAIRRWIAAADRRPPG